jgi:hypothetical protein
VANIDREIRVYKLMDNLHDEISIELKKMEHDLELLEDRNITTEEFVKRVRESEKWIIHFVHMEDSLRIELDLERRDE